MKTKRTERNGLLRVICPIICPRCKNKFGLDTEFVERFGDVNIHYKCPYCNYEAGLK